MNNIQDIHQMFKQLAQVLNMSKNYREMLEFLIKKEMGNSNVHVQKCFYNVASTERGYEIVISIQINTSVYEFHENMIDMTIPHAIWIAVGQALIQFQKEVEKAIQATKKMLEESGIQEKIAIGKLAGTC